MYARIQAWFETHHTLTAMPKRDRPRGIYALDSRYGTAYDEGTLRDANVRNYAFVTGYVLRVSWDFIEPTRDAYDFKIIDNIFTKLPEGQKLSLICVPYEPAYIASEDGVTTWTDENRATGEPMARAVPWDPSVQERYRAYLAALAAHEVGGLPLAERPELEAINTFLPGSHTGIRDPNTARLRDLPGYTREGFQAAVLDVLRTLTNVFPDQYVQIGFWPVTDYDGGTEAWESIRQTVLGEFDGVFRPKVGFFMENLAASRPAVDTDPVTGYPTTTYGAPLYDSQAQTWTAFQALTSWLQPFTGAEKVANATPADGMRYAYDTYGCTYFELYVADLDKTDWHPLFQEWHDRLVPTPASGVPPVWSLY